MDRRAFLLASGILFVVIGFLPLSNPKNHITRKENKFRKTCESDEAVSGFAFHGIKGSKDYKIVIKCRSLLSKKDKKKRAKIVKGKVRYTGYVNLGGKATSNDISKTCQGGEYIRGVEGVFVENQRRIRFKCQSTDQGTKRVSGSVRATLCYSASVDLDINKVRLNSDPLGSVDDGFPLHAVNYVELDGLSITARFCSMKVQGIDYSEEYNNLLEKVDSSHECSNDCCRCNCDKACEIECQKEDASKESSEESSDSSSDDGCIPGIKMEKHFGMSCGLKCKMHCAIWRRGTVFGKPIAGCKTKKGDKKESCFCEYDATLGAGGEGRCSEDDPETAGTKSEQVGGDETASNDEEKWCTDEPEMDIVFVIDESSSVGTVNYKKGLAYVSRLCQSFDVDSGKCRVAGMRYSGLSYKGINVDFGLATHNTNSEACSAFAAMQYAAGVTATGEALRVAKNKVLSAARPTATKVVIVLTDGNTNNGVHPRMPADELRAMGAVTVAIGVGGGNRGINPDELLAIAGSSDNVFNEPSYDALATSNITKVLTAICTQAKVAMATQSCMGGCRDSGTLFQIVGDCKAGSRQHKRPDDTKEKWFGAGNCKKEGKCDTKCASWKPARGYESYTAICEPKQNTKNDLCHCMYSSCEAMCRGYAPGIAYGENSVAECRPKTCFQDDDDDDSDGGNSSNHKDKDSRDDDSDSDNDNDDDDDNHVFEESESSESNSRRRARDVTTSATGYDSQEEEGEGWTLTTEKWFGAGHCKKEGKCDKKCARWKPAADYGSYEAICEPKREGKKDFCHCIYETTSAENCEMHECYCEYVNPGIACKRAGGGGATGEGEGGGAGGGGGRAKPVHQGLSVGVKECTKEKWFGQAFCKDVNTDSGFDKTTYDKTKVDAAHLTHCKRKCESWKPGLRVHPNPGYECDFKNGANSKTHCHCKYESEDCADTSQAKRRRRTPHRTRQKREAHAVVCAADHPTCSCGPCECNRRD